MDYEDMVDILINEWDMYEEDADEYAQKALKSGISTHCQLDTWVYVNAKM